MFFIILFWLSSKSWAVSPSSSCFIPFETVSGLKVMESTGAPGLLVLRDWAELPQVGSADFQNILARAPQFMDEVGTRPSGVKVRAGSNYLPYAHEWSSSARFARVLQQESGEFLLAISTLDGTAVPGYDGIIVGADGQIKANFSLKNTFGYGLETPVLRGLEKGRNSRRLQNWLVKASKNYYAESWARKTAALFGVVKKETESRPFRLFVEIDPKGPALSLLRIPWFQEQIKEEKGGLQSIVLLKGQEYMVITEDGARIQGLRE